MPSDTPCSSDDESTANAPDREGRPESLLDNTSWPEGRYLV